MPTLEQIKARVPCLAKAKRDFAARQMAINPNAGPWVIFLDMLDDDRRAYTEAAKPLPPKQEKPAPSWAGNFADLV